MVSSLLNRYWRVVGTAMSFTLFGVGGIILGLFVFPAMLLLIKNRLQRQLLARNIIMRSFQVFINIMSWLGIISYSVHHQELLNRTGLLIVANHPTLLDVVFLIAITANADCVVKKSLFYNPFTWGVVRAAGYIRNDSGEQVIEHAIRSIKGGCNLIIFPEGTRSRKGVYPAFQRGAANIAVRGCFPLTPVLITCIPPTLKKGDSWYNVPSKKPHFCIQVKPDILWSDLPFNAESLAVVKKVRLLTNFLHQYFMSDIHDEYSRTGS